MPRRQAMALAAVFFLLFTCQGCVGLSLHPFYTEDALSGEGEITGLWQEVTDDPALAGGRWTFTPGEGGSLLLRVEREEGSPLFFVVHLFTVGGVGLLDFYPDLSSLPEEVRDLVGIHLLPVHVVARVEREGKRMRLCFLDGEWLKAQGEGLPAHALTTEGLVLLTAESKEIGAFLAENLSAAFAGGPVVELVRLSP